MKHFSLNLETVSPVAIRADHAPGGVENAGYISGTTLLGSLAALHRLSHPGDRPAFEQLFLSGQVHYPDLYPASFKQDPLQDSIDLPIYPLPKTAQSCKRYPGFKPRKGKEDDEDDGHGARDSLIDMAIFALAERAQRSGQAIDWDKLIAWLQKWAVCPICEKPMDHFSGYYRRSDVGNRMAQASAETRLQTRTGINRETGTVQENILYSRQVFQEHARFWGEIAIEDDLTLISALQQFISEIGVHGLARIGTGRSRGMGKINLALGDSKQQTFTEFKERVQTFNTTFHEQARETIPHLLDAALFYFVLTLHSPVILRDDLLRYRGVIDGQALGELLQVPADSFDLVYQNADTRQILGWNELWGLPRTKEVAIDTGSVFLFATSIKDEEGLEELLSTLFKLEQAGVGRRKAEGFGRICVSDEFHREMKLK